MPLKVSVQGNAGPRLTAIENALEDLHEPIEEIGVKFRELIVQNFDSSGSPLPWEKLSEPYATYKASKYPGAGILYREGNMFKAATVKGADGNLSIVTKNTGRFGLDINSFTPPYPIYHQKGTRKMPQRKVVQLSDDEKKTLTDSTIFAYVKNVIRGLRK